MWMHGVRVNGVDGVSERCGWCEGEGCGCMV